MNHPLPEPGWQRAAEQTVLVVVLHQAGAEHMALGLTRAWAPAVPAAVLSALCVADENGAKEVWEEVAIRLGQAGLDPSRLVLAGIGNVQDMALQVAFGQAAAGCAGVLACGNVSLPLGMLAGQPKPGRPKLRLVWTADDPPFSAAALGDLLRCLRVAGLDAQGAVLPGATRLPTEADGYPALDPPLVRLSRAYLAELVAVALSAAPRPGGSPAWAEQDIHGSPRPASGFAKGARPSPPPEHLARTRSEGQGSPGETGIIPAGAQT